MINYSLLSITREHFIAFWIATLMVIGRWNFSRLVGDIDIPIFLYEPRVLILSLATLFLILQPPRYLIPNNKGFQTIIIFSVLVAFFIAIQLLTVGKASNFSVTDGGYVEQKRIDVFFIFLSTIIVAIELRRCNSKKLVSLIWYMLFLYTALFSIFALMGYSRGAVSATAHIQQQRISTLGGGPNVFARFMILCVLFSLIHLKSTSQIRLKIAFGFFSTVALILLFLSGSRGGWVAGLVGIIIFFVQDIRRLKSFIFPILVFFLVLAIVVTFTPFGTFLQQMWQVRFIDQTITQQYSSGRTQIYVESLNLIQDNLWTGVGLGKYILYNASGQRYPHNLFLEVTLESGIFGLLLLIIIIGVVLWQGNSKTLRNNPYAYLSYIAFISLLVASQFSGDIYDSRSIFLLGLMTLSHHITSANREKGIL